MADKKISQLTSATTPLTGSEEVPLVQGGVTKKVAVEKLQSGPAFSAYPAHQQLVADATFVKMVFDTEEFDTASCFDTTKSRFTPNVAGYYQITLGITGSGLITGNTNSLVYKNGSLAKSIANLPNTAGYPQAAGTALIYMNGTTDYLEAYVYQTTGVDTYMYAGAAYTFFQGVLVRGA